MRGALVRERMKTTGMIIGTCFTAVDGLDAVNWIQQQAQEQCLNETRICRNLLNEMIRIKMAEEKK